MKGTMSELEASDFFDSAPLQALKPNGDAANCS